MRLERESASPSIHPACGQRTSDSSCDQRQYRYSVASTASGSACWATRRRDAGARSAIACSIVRSLPAIAAPKRDLASASTVRAGANSVSTTTGLPPSSWTRTSGRFPPARTPIGSAWRTSRSLHRGFRVRRAAASAPLKVCSSFTGPTRAAGIAAGGCASGHGPRES